MVVLDNCEHLVEACAELTEALLQQARDVIVLATSREALRIPDETVWRVPPLPVDVLDRLLRSRPDDGDELEAAEEHDQDQTGERHDPGQECDFHRHLLLS
jgi:predicted ATPase